MHSADSLGSAALAEVLRRQHHVIGRDQALACGLSHAALRYRLRGGGSWETLLPGVYRAVTGPVPADQRDMAALLHAGPRSALTGMAAARHFGFQVSDADPVDVVIPMNVRRQSTGFVRVQRSERMPADVCVAGEIRFVLPARAVADAARRMRNAREVRALIAQTVQQQRCTIEMLTIELAQGPAQGSAFLRAALEEVRDGIRSVPEGDLRVLLRRGRLPIPMFNARLYDDKKALIAVADCWWDDAGVAAEVDSREYHYSAEDWQRTMRRHDRLVARGVQVLHFTPARIRAEPQAVAAEIRSALIAGRDRPRLPIRSLPAAA